MSKVYCRYCGKSTLTVASLIKETCPNHPRGYHKAMHALYEGSGKSQYVCKSCGKKASSIATLTKEMCPEHPFGYNNGRHEPAI